MARYCFYIDGFNVYYALQENQSYHKYKWLNYRKLAESVIRAQDTIASVYYFTAVVRWRQENANRHARYIRVLRSVGVETIQGRFMNKRVRCHLCGKEFLTHEEKRTDVNIALKILGDAIDDMFDIAVVVSADSDLLPALESVGRRFPEKKIGVMFPIGRSSADLRQIAHFRLRMREQVLKDCQFPDEVHVGKAVLTRPDTWR
jgi:uncharacterized LabA/DUF88 family protein